MIYYIERFFIMFIHEGNNMTNIVKKIYLIVILSSFFAIDKSIASEPITNITTPFSLLNTAEAWISKGQNAQIAACSFLVFYLCHQYYNHKTRPQDEDLTEEAYNTRWYQIAHGDYSLVEKIKMLISFVDDFYVFGRRSKSLETTTKTKASDGTITVTKDKKTVIKGRGPVNFLYDKVFDGLENTIKSLGALTTLVLIVDRLLNGRFDYLLKPTKADYVIGK